MIKKNLREIAVHVICTKSTNVIILVFMIFVESGYPTYLEIKSRKKLTKQ